MSTLRIGALFAGYGGLEMGVQAVLAGGVAWYSEIEPAAIRVLEHHHPGVPNLGDITAVDWSAVESVDVLTGGFPCQDVSSAGRRVGMRPGTRSGLWSHMRYAISRLRPPLVVIENVRGLFSAKAHRDVEPDAEDLGNGQTEPVLRALGAVLGDLSDLGYVGRWHGLRASDVGAAHGRFRVFICAWPAAGHAALPGRDAQSDAGAGEHRQPARAAGRPGGAAADTAGQGWGRGTAAVGGALPLPPGAGPLVQHGGCDSTPAHADGERPQGSRPAGSPICGGRRPGDPDGAAPAHSQGDGRGEGRPEPARLLGGSDAALCGDATTADTDRDGLTGRAEHDGAKTEAGSASAARRGHTDGRPGATAWGDYTPAIRRWELILGRPAPEPTWSGKRGGRQLSPLFVEWLMGLPEGHVTAVPGLSRNEQLKLLGNGVVPVQASYALSWLLASTSQRGEAA